MRDDLIKEIFMKKNRAVVYLISLFVLVVLLVFGLVISGYQLWEAGSDFDWSKYLIGATSDKNEDDWRVIRVVDGDTIVVEQAGKEEKVRLIGINSPESVDPRKEVECFGKEASAKLKEWLDGKIVQLERDDSQGNVDKYGRLLRYVWLEGNNINRKMVEEGFAYEYTYDLPYKYQVVFQEAEQLARDGQRGLWSSCK